MLMLIRRKGESIMIGDDIEVKLVELKPHLAIIGIDAPAALKIHRQECYALQHAKDEDKTHE